MVARFNLNVDQSIQMDGTMKVVWYPSREGEWVRYADYADRIAELEATIKRKENEMNKPLSIADTVESEGSMSRTLCLAHRVAMELAAATTASEFKKVLQTFEVEPLDCLHALLGSYLEDRSRVKAGSIIDEPF